MLMSRTISKNQPKVGNTLLVGHRRLYCPHQINVQRRWDR